MNLIEQTVKRLILKSIKPMERRGITFQMRCKNLPADVRGDIVSATYKSFCPYPHFDVAFRALKYINDRRVLGDVVLCGVSKGGMAWFLKKHMGGNRRLWLYDTFDGGPLPSLEHDGINSVDCGEHTKLMMAADVKSVMAYVGESQCEWVVGDIMETVPSRLPDRIALLYLDTDWYESTRHELMHMEPRVEPGGVIIQDDMGLCPGAEKAVREYYGPSLPFITPMTEAGSSWVKQ